MKIIEFRLRIPLDCNEAFHKGWLYTLSKISEEESGGGEGVEIVEAVREADPSLPHLDLDIAPTIRTLKRYHLGSNLPKAIATALPSGSAVLDEQSYTSFPYCRTEMTSGYMKDNLTFSLATLHLGSESMDTPFPSNALGLSDKDVSRRVVHALPSSVANGWQRELDEADATQPASLRRSSSSSSSSAPSQPYTMIVKVLRLNFSWFGLQNLVERFIVNYLGKLFERTVRDIWSYRDEWSSLSLAQVRALEREAAIRLALAVGGVSREEAEARVAGMIVDEEGGAKDGGGGGAKGKRRTRKKVAK
mmetsp:Transcript_6843/g.22013  ORF Transcript_6843/g.22013 Transcript_6843/m.22013 type:complete len:305 (-) Transcript_6843:466-1380(-)